MGLTAVTEIDAREGSVECSVESRDMNLSEIRVGEMLAADTCDGHAVDDRQAKFDGEEIVDAAGGRTGVYERA